MTHVWQPEIDELAHRSPFRSAEAFEIDDVIDPRDTRLVLCRWANLVAPMRTPGTMARTFRPLQRFSPSSRFDLTQASPR